MKKHLPDKFYENDPSMWMTTTGSEKAPTSRPIHINKVENRSTTTREYEGNARGNMGVNHILLLVVLEVLDIILPKIWQ